jgi:UDP-glucuronate decarboxylase
MHHLERGDKVLCIDNFCSALGTISNPSPHFRELLSFENFSYMPSDIAGPNMLQELSDWEGDLIYNFACPASPPRYQAMPVETMLTCVVGTRNMLEVARRTGAVLVHASTSEVYGDPEHSPQAEKYRGCVNSYGPRACYDEGKRAAEALCYDYLNKYDVDARMVRIFNTYGPNMDPDDGRVVSNFICQALRGQPITIYGNGQQTRSFCYVSDLVRGITNLGEYSRNPHTPVNMGNPVEFTIRELAEKVQDLLGAVRFKAMPLPIDDPLQRRPDISLATDLLGWEPKVQLEEGLSHTISYFEKMVKKK